MKFYLDLLTRLHTVAFGFRDNFAFTVLGYHSVRVDLYSGGIRFEYQHDYPPSLFTSVSPNEYQDNTLKDATTAFTPIVITLLFITISLFYLMLEGCIPVFHVACF
jgi:hypothetical protein